MSCAILTFALPPAADGIQLTPAGPAFRAADGSGRPADVAAWRIDRQIAEALIAQQAAKKNALVIDYEHQTLQAERNGQPAPAAGWFSDLEWREGAGLFATGVQWTDRAAAMIAAGEYRYISPVFEYDRRTGAVKSIRMAALTNDPGLDGLRAVALRAHLDSLEEQNTMDEILQKLLKALALPDGTDTDTALTAVAALKSAAAAVQTELAALKATPPTAPDPAKYAPLAVITELQNEVAALRASQDKGVVDTLFRQAREAGKVISPEYEAHLRTIPVVALKGVLDGLVSMAALKGMQSDGTHSGAGDKPGASAPSAPDLAVMKALGLSAEEYAKGKD
ncbi:MAG: phage protease [Azoarcus sp.]|jgi:phage I-like protein|nr:phage protease [Azoarcus sp.]